MPFYSIFFFFYQIFKSIFLSGFRSPSISLTNTPCVLLPTILPILHFCLGLIFPTYSYIPPRGTSRRLGWILATGAVVKGGAATVGAGTPRAGPPPPPSHPTPEAVPFSIEFRIPLSATTADLFAAAEDWIHTIPYPPPNRLFPLWARSAAGRSVRQGEGPPHGCGCPHPRRASAA